MGSICPAGPVCLLAGTVCALASWISPLALSYWHALSIWDIFFFLCWLCSRSVFTKDPSEPGTDMTMYWSRAQWYEILESRRSLQLELKAHSTASASRVKWRERALDGADLITSLRTAVRWCGGAARTASLNTVITFEWVLTVAAGECAVSARRLGEAERIQTPSVSGCLLNMRGRGCVRLNNVSLWADLFISPVDNPSDNVSGGPPPSPAPTSPSCHLFVFVSL